MSNVALLKLAFSSLTEKELQKMNRYVEKGGEFLTGIKAKTNFVFNGKS